MHHHLTVKGSKTRINVTTVEQSLNTNDHGVNLSKTAILDTNVELLQNKSNATMAKLADAPDLSPGVRKSVWVRVPRVAQDQHLLVA